jgi:mobilization protein NikA
MGRPTVSDPRDRQLKLNLTIAEYESLVARARAVGMRPVHFGRALLVNSDCVTAQSRRAPSHIEKLNYSALVRLGNNLNQMMRHLHQTGDPIPADLEPLLTDIRKVIARGVQK